MTNAQSRALRTLVSATLSATAQCALAQTDGAALFDAAHHEDHIAPCNLPAQPEGPFADRSTWASNLWPSGVVPYELDANVSATNATRLRIAMNELETAANIRFVPRTNQSAYIHVQGSNGNNSYVGRTGGAQTLNLYNWSYRYIIAHELMHALGMWHEQQRPDRANFVTIVSANIQNGYESNFTVRSNATVVGPFDFESVMLYDDCSFSTCCPAGSSCGCAVSCATILALPAYAQQQNAMGNLNYLSAGDKLGLAARYGDPVDDSLENNDTHATAAAIAANTTHNLRLIDTEDYFQVNLTAPATLTATLTAGVWAGANLTAHVIDAAGAVLHTTSMQDPDGDGTYSGVATTPLPAGSARIRVTRSEPWGGDYTLAVTLTPTPSGCDSLDFNRDTLTPDTADINDFLSVFAGGPCSNAAGCGDVDFNNDGLYPDSADIDAFLRVFAGGPCS